MESEVYADARVGRFGVLLCWRLDRLSQQGCSGPNTRSLTLIEEPTAWPGHPTRRRDSVVGDYRCLRPGSRVVREPDHHESREGSDGAAGVGALGAGGGWVILRGLIVGRVRDRGELPMDSPHRSGHRERQYHLSFSRVVFPIDVEVGDCADMKALGFGLRL